VDRLLSRAFSRYEVTALFAAMPPRYFLMHTAKDIVADVTLAHQFMHLQVGEDDRALGAVVAWHNEPDRGYTRAKVCTWDRAGLFSKMTGSFSAAGINILSAQAFSRRDGVVLDTFFVTDGRTGKLVNREERERFEKVLGQALTGEAVDFRSLIARQKTVPPLYRGFEDERLPNRVRFDNQASDSRTVIEVETEDRLGVLYVISQVLAELGLDISLAKVSTEKGAAIDSFYVSDADGQKVVAPDRQQFIEEKLRAALAGLGT
jgi:[protein-PII] uridylyltransferase